jgi:2-octaprenyl-6-methoxyphenol hydroxylase
VTRYGDIVTALGAACLKAGIPMLRPARVKNIDEQADHVRVVLAGDVPAVRAAIVVQAEGGLFSDQASRSQRRDYQQAPSSHRCTPTAPSLRAPTNALRTRSAGPAAAGSGRRCRRILAGVVSAPKKRRACRRSATQLPRRTGAAFGTRLGRFVHATPRLAFPLGLNADPRSTARTVAIGNAAQTLHPVAGQGLNLGLRDVAVLAKGAGTRRRSAHLAQFTVLREQNRQTTVRITDTMARIFASTSPLQSLLGLSLTAIDLVPPARNMLAELLMYGRR